MPSHLLKRIVALALALALVAPWAVLQSVAWAGMIVSYSESAPLAVALQKTFDGKHPCCLCTEIAAARRGAKQKCATLQIKRLEFTITAEMPAPRTSPAFQLLPAAGNDFAPARSRKPPLPPPRSFFV